jgi:hypothetical protein
MDLNGNKESFSPSAVKRKGGDKKDLFHVIHKVPAGDSPYVRAKHLQVCFGISFYDYSFDIILLYCKLFMES